MFLKLYKSKHPSIFYLMLLTSLALWSKTLFFSDSPIIETSTNMPLYQMLINLFDGNVLLQNFTAYLMLAFQSILLVVLNKRHGFINYQGYLYVLIFFFVSSGMSSMQQLSAPLFSNLFFLFALSMVLSAFQKSNALSILFNTGILLNIATLFYAGMVFYILVLWIATIIIRGLDFRELIVMLLGYLTPFILILGFSYVFASLEIYNLSLEKALYNIDFDNKFVVAYGCILLLLLVLSILNTYVNNTIKISSRKFIQILLSIVWLTPVVYLLIPFVSFELLYMMAIPASFLITQYLVSSRASLWTEFVFDGFCIVLILLQIYS